MAPPMDALVARLRGASAEMTPPVVGASKKSVTILNVIVFFGLRLGNGQNRSDDF